MANPVGTELIRAIGAATAGGPAATDEYFTAQQIANLGSGTGVPSIAGTANQINQTGSPGATTLSLSSTITLPGTINKLTLTAPATGSTLTIADGKTETFSNTLTFTGTDGSSINFVGGGAVAYEEPITTQSGTAYTLVLGDRGGYILFTAGSAVTLTVPTNASVAFPVNTVITYEQNNAGVVTTTAAGGVTLNSSGSLVATNGQYAVVSLKKVATNTWTLFGNLA